MSSSDSGVPEFLTILGEGTHANEAAIHQWIGTLDAFYCVLSLPVSSDLTVPSVAEAYISGSITCRRCPVPLERLRVQGRRGS